MRSVILAAVFFVLLSPNALAQVSHAASEVNPGTFATGEYVFPSSLKFGTGGYILVPSAATPRLALTDQNGAGVLYVKDGSVGIGTASPLDKLDVAGEARIRGGINVMEIGRAAG